MDIDNAEALARRNLYLFLSVGFSDPVEERFDLLEEDEFREATKQSIKFLQTNQTLLASTGEDELVKHNLDLEMFLDNPDWNRKGVRQEYKSVFGLTIDEDCPPHEVEYCEKTDLFYRSQLMADIGGFYRAFGLNSDKDRPERVDHVRLELEFMYYLWTKLINGLEKDHDESELELVQNGLNDFFAEHLGWWIPRFGRALEEKEGSDFYAQLGRLVRWFSLRERLAFNLPVFDERPEPNVPDADPEAACFDCGVSKMGGDDREIKT